MADDVIFPVELGFEPRLYFSTTPIPADGTPPEWTELTMASNVTGPGKFDKVDVTTRGGRGTKQSAKGLNDGELAFETPYQKGHPDLIALLLQATTRGAGGMTAFAIMDGDITVAGSYGAWGNFEIFEFPREEPIEKDVRVKWKCAIGQSNYPMTWVTVGA